MILRVHTYVWSVRMVTEKTWYKKELVGKMLNGRKLRRNLLKFLASWLGFRATKIFGHKEFRMRDEERDDPVIWNAQQSVTTRHLGFNSSYIRIIFQLRS